MTELLETFRYFHFIRPGWLLLIPAIAVLWWRIRRRANARTEPPEGIATHLSEALTVGRREGARLQVVDGLGLVVLLIAIATAGPTWSRVPNPLVAQTAPLAVVLCTSESMLATDVPPSRLERAKQKLLDLIELRAGARTSLVAYAGTAHRVVPLTEDPLVLKPFIEGLSPKIMPESGKDATAALQLARETMASEETRGAILFVLDGMDSVDFDAFRSHAENEGEGVILLATCSSERELDALRRVPDAALVPLTPDRRDVLEVERRAQSAFREALSQDDRQQWDDRGWVLAGVAALLTLLWFRRGWAMQWAVLCVMLSSCSRSDADPSRGISSWFWTPDQQGRLAFEDKEFARAAACFEDPWWKGYALSFNGKYIEAAEIYARGASADAACAEGTALVKGRDYPGAIRAFEKALERDPHHARSIRNLELARAILEYVEDAREAADTGDGSEGADEIVYDKQSEGGYEQTVLEEKKIEPQSAEQWMRTVDTRTSDFLRLRFQIEASRSQ